MTTCQPTKKETIKNIRYRENYSIFTR